MRAFLYFTITAIFWGLNFHFAKMMLQEVGFIEAGFWRYLFGVIPLFFLVYKKLPTPSLILKNIKGISLVGIICLFGFNLLFFGGLIHSPAINGALFISMTPALTLLFSTRILNTPLQRKQLVGVVISFLGVIYLLLKGNVRSFDALEFSWSDLLLLGAATVFALQNVWVKIYGGDLSNKDFTFLTNLFCMLSFLFLLPFVGVETVSEYSSTFWLAAIGIGCFGTSLAYYLWNAGIQLTSPAQAGIFINVVPLSTAFFSVAFGEVLLDYHLVSGILIILGVLIIMK